MGLPFSAELIAKFIIVL